MTRSGNRTPQSTSRRKTAIIIAILILGLGSGCAMVKRMQCRVCGGDGKCKVCGGDGTPMFTWFTDKCGVCNGTGSCQECEGMGF